MIITLLITDCKRAESGRDRGTVALPMAPRPAIPREDLDVVARAIAAGRRQTQIAVEQGWHKQRVQRCCAVLRTEVAAKLGPEWLDGAERSVTLVAQQWLLLPTRQ